MESYQKILIHTILLRNAEKSPEMTFSYVNRFVERIKSPFPKVSLNI